MEERLARIESDVKHIQSDVTDIKADVRRLDNKIDGVKDSLASAKVWALLLYIALAATLLGVMAKGFKWI